MRFCKTIALVALCMAPHALAQTTLIEAYGQLPEIRDIAISPDGTHYALIKRFKGEELFLVVSADTNEVVGGANAAEIKPRRVFFATNRYAVLAVSETKSRTDIRDKWEQDHAVAYDLNEDRLIPLLAREETLYRAQSGLSNVLGVNRKKEAVYIGAYIGETSPRYHLMEVRLRDGRARRHAKGNQDTVDWFVGNDGRVLAREDFSGTRHTIHSYTQGKRRVIYKTETELPEIAIVGINAQEDALVFIDENDVGEAVYEMSLVDGSVTGPAYQQTDYDIDQITTRGANRQYAGVRVSGPVPEYFYLDERTQSGYQSVAATFPDSTVVPRSATRDGGKVIYSVSGNDAAEDYVLFDVASRQLRVIGRSYPAVSRESIAQIDHIQYPAADGQSLNGVLTWPVGVTERAQLPLLVLPHGGPESYDHVRFDWWAQYFARRGYLVLQPNFRGSTGHGVKYRNDGRGEWGRLMQDDISDGVRALVRADFADGERVCIMGASYGGYAALAGGAYTPELYRCVISVAGVSDVVQMLRDEKRSASDWVVNYWEEVIGDSAKERDKLREISPFYSANTFTAPVLLIHGKDDTVVSMQQSQRMHRALRRAKKQSELVKLKGEDHWLSVSETRTAMLEAISRFLDVHNPVDAPM